MAEPGVLANPRTLRGIVLADLYRGQRLVKNVHPDPIDPQFRIASPEGDWAIAITLPDDPKQRQRRLELVLDFMALKQAPSFVIASALFEPDCVYAMGFWHKERHGCLSRITRTPALDFGPVAWMPEAALGPDIPGLLPRGMRTLSADRLLVLQAWFGRDGKFPAVNIETGQIGA